MITTIRRLQRASGSSNDVKKQITYYFLTPRHTSTHTARVQACISPIGAHNPFFGGGGGEGGWDRNIPALATPSYKKKHSPLPTMFSRQTRGESLAFVLDHQKKKLQKMNVNKQINAYPTCCRRDDGR